MHKPGRFENISEAEILSPRECEEKLDSYFNTGSLQELLLCFVGHCMFNKQGRFEDFGTNSNSPQSKITRIFC